MIFEADNILIRGVNWIGDAVMTLPAVAAIRNTFPQARITMLVKPWVADIFRLCPDVDETMIYRRPGAHEGLRGLFGLVGEIRTRRFDAAILLQNAVEAAIIALLAGIPVRAGYNTDGRGLLLTHSVKRAEAVLKLPQSDYYLEMVKSLGCRPREKEAFLHPGKQPSADDLLARYDLKDARLLVGMAPGAAYGPAKRWFPERFARVADRLLADYGAQVLLFGSADDAESIARVQQAATAPLLSLAGKTTLHEAIALIARCGLFISNDSGLMHTAAALGVPTVAIFGSTNPATTSPPGRKNIVIYKNVPCSPCLKTDCPTDFQCMESIGIDDVYKAAIRMLEAT